MTTQKLKKNLTKEKIEMTFLEYLEACGIDTKKQEVTNWEKGQFKIQTAIAMAIEDILSIKSSFYNEMIDHGFTFNFERGIDLPKDPIPQSIKTFIQTYQNDISI